MFSILFATGGVSAAATPVPATDDMIFGTTRVFRTDYGGYTNADFYYSDSWFNNDPSEVNYSLALSSILFSASAANSTNGVNYLKEIGFEDATAKNYNSSTEYSCAYTYGTKLLDEDTTLVAISIQSSLYSFKEWSQNVQVNDESVSNPFHHGLYLVTQNIVDEISQIPSTQNVKYWISGASRGGAIASILTYMLSENTYTNLSKKNVEFFTYVFEAPTVYDVGNSGENNLTRKFSFIHNFVSTDDVVCALPIWNMVLPGNVYYLNEIVNGEDSIPYIKRIYESGDFNASNLYSDEAVTFCSNLQTRFTNLTKTRAGYSTDITDEIRYGTGPFDIETIATVTYNYQDSLDVYIQNISKIFWTDNLKDFVSMLNTQQNLIYVGEALVGAIFEQYTEKYPVNQGVVEAIRNEIAIKYLPYDAASNLTDQVNDILDSEITVDQTYGFLKMLAYALLDHEQIKEAYK
ncbi:MAG: hypothetical protein K6G11_06945, partial [Lachnospiraceae bacterium]|nr:hypothetical protein [Lachnospiraceae bacterium]